MKIQAYLAFNGNCQQALNYYANLFGAEVKNRETYEDKKMDVPASYRQKLQHAGAWQSMTGPGSRERCRGRREREPSCVAFDGGDVFCDEI